MAREASDKEVKLEPESTSPGEADFSQDIPDDIIEILQQNPKLIEALRDPQIRTVCLIAYKIKKILRKLGFIS